MSTRTVDNPKIVSKEEWLDARKKLLAREKQLTRDRDAVAAERRQLPWVKVDKTYVFDSPTGRKTLGDLFNGKSQLTAPSGRKAARAAPSIWTIPMVRWYISRSATSRLQPFPGRPFPRSMRSRSEWAGSSIGSRPTTVTSITTTTLRSHRSRSPKGKSTTTTNSWNFQVRKHRA